MTENQAKTILADIKAEVQTVITEVTSAHSNAADAVADLESIVAEYYQYQSRINQSHTYVINNYGG